MWWGNFSSSRFEFSGDERTNIAQVIEPVSSGSKPNMLITKKKFYHTIKNDILREKIRGLLEENSGVVSSGLAGCEPAGRMQCSIYYRAVMALDLFEVPHTYRSSSSD